jgi:hypothetical protein
MKQIVFHQTPVKLIMFRYIPALCNIETICVSPNTPKLIMCRHNETMKLSIVRKAWLGVLPTANSKQLRENDRFPLLL